MERMKKKKKATGVRKGMVALFLPKDNYVLSGDCTYTARKFDSGEIIIEITLLKRVDPYVGKQRG